MSATKYLAEDQISDDGNDTIELGVPYRLRVGIVGTADILFHRWSVEGVAEKAAAPKGSAAKKTDDLESYVYRDDDGYLGVAGVNFASCIWQAGKFMQDPRSSRKTAFDLCRAGVVPLDRVATLEPMTKKWDYDNQARVNIQRSGVTRTRPAMHKGWKITFDLLITTPEYLGFERMAELITNGGRLVGLCDFRPTYGRFTVSGMQMLSYTDE